MIDFQERLDPDRPHPLWGEHRARYRFATGYVAGATVVDAACGNGYGSEMLAAASASRVVGVDLAEDAVHFGRSRYREGGALFLRGDVTRMPFPQATFDVVISFETIEHVHDPDKVVAEFERVLKPSGILLISSPNGAMYPGGHSGNPYHVKEFTVAEFRRLLSHFRDIRIHGQRLPRLGVLNYSGKPRALTEERLGSLRMLTRRAFSLLPLPLKDLVWRMARKESYYPREDEFDFVEDHPEAYPVIVASARRHSG